MNLLEAIQRIQEDIDHNYYELDSPLKKAFQLGIAALERVLDSRRPDPLYPDMLLPGETEGKGVENREVGIGQV